MAFVSLKGGNDVYFTHLSFHHNTINLILSIARIDSLAPDLPLW
jgi:hypothetical protein